LGRILHVDGTRDERHRLLRIGDIVVMAAGLVIDLGAFHDQRYQLLLQFRNVRQLNFAAV